MEVFKNQVFSIVNDHLTYNQMVTILELIVDKIDIDTVSQIARKENKSRNGILISNNYKKINIGKQKFAIIGIKEDNLPF